ISLRAAKPHPRIIFDVGLRDGDFDATWSNRDRRQSSNGTRRNLSDIAAKILPFVVRKEAVFFWVVNGIALRKIEASFFLVNLDLLLRERSFEAISDAFIVGAEDDGIVSLHIEAQLVIAVWNLCKLLFDSGFNDLIVAALLARFYFWG